MGSGITQSLIQRGMKVILFDTKFAIIERGIGLISKSMDKQVKKGLLTAEAAQQDQYLSTCHCCGHRCPSRCLGHPLNQQTGPLLQWRSADSKQTC